MGDKSVEEYWESFRHAGGVDAERHGTFAFGDSTEMADELAGLVVRGPKRATAGLLLDYERDHDPLPREGGFAVVVDGRGLPVAVVRTSQVEVKPLREVDAAFAWDEGEGDALNRLTARGVVRNVVRSGHRYPDVGIRRRPGFRLDAGRLRRIG